MTEESDAAWQLLGSLIQLKEIVDDLIKRASAGGDIPIAVLGKVLDLLAADVNLAEILARGVDKR